MKRALPVLALVSCLRASADLLPLADDAALKPWGKKVNTSLARGADGSLRMTVRAGEFAYGWIQRPLSAADVAIQPQGLYGRFRAAPESRAQLSLTLILSDGTSRAYYTCAQGDLGESRGEWIGLYAPLSAFKPERSASARSLKASDLRAGDSVQISLSGIAGAQAVAEFDQLRFLAKPEADKIGPALRREKLARMLLPETRGTGAPHPRLLMNPARLQRVKAKAKAGGDAQAAYEALLKQADGYLRTLDAERPVAGVLAFEPTGEVTSHQRSGQLEGRLTAAVIPIETLAAAYQITGDERYGRHAAKALVAAARSLDTDNALLNSGFYYTRTFYVRALAFGYDWLWPLLTPDERRDVKTTLLGFVLQIHADSWGASWGRRPLHRVWNWDPGLVSCAGLGMLALEGETTSAEKAILVDLRRHLRDYLTFGIDADGAGHEGPGYLAYGIGAGPEFAECLREQERGDLFTETNWRQIPSWLVSETLPDRTRWNNLSDCGHGQSPASVYSYTCGRLAELARTSPAVPGERLPAPESLLAAKDFLWQFAEYPGPRPLSYTALAALMGWEWEVGGLGRNIAGSRAPALLAYLLFYEACPIASDPAALLPDALHFRGRGLAVSRTSYETNALHFAVEAGPHAAGHDQADKGSFTLYGYGADLAVDSGYGNDGDALKSGSSHAHNMVLINGQGQPMHWHNQSSGHISGYHHSGLLDWVRVDAREAWNTRYDGEWQPVAAAEPVDKAVRHFLFVRGNGRTPPYLVVMDDIRKNGQPADYIWLWHIPDDMRFQFAADRWTASPVRLAGSMLTTAAGRPRGGARFAFTAPADGRYMIAGLTRAGGADSGKSDSFFVSVNGGKRATWDLQNARGFSWEPFIAAGTGMTNLLTMKAGETLRVDLAAREAEAQLVKLALVPENTPLAIASDEQPAGGVTRTAAEAVLLDPPLLRKSVAESERIGARLTVFPVTTDARQATNRWYATSREGTHPRLEHTVKAVEPRFLMVLVPGTDQTPLPQVRRLAVSDGAGAEIVWGDVTDHIVFGEGRLQKAGGLETDGRAAYVRREAGKVTGWALLDGTRLSTDGVEKVALSGRKTVADSTQPR